MISNDRLLIKESIKCDIKRSLNIITCKCTGPRFLCDLPKDLIIAIPSSLLGVFTIISRLLYPISQYEKMLHVS